VDIDIAADDHGAIAVLMHGDSEQLARVDPTTRARALKALTRRVHEGVQASNAIGVAPDALELRDLAWAAMRCAALDDGVRNTSAAV
jgi:hypothetical protein